MVYLAGTNTRVNRVQRETVGRSWEVAVLGERLAVKRLDDELADARERRAQPEAEAEEAGSSRRRRDVINAKQRLRLRNGPEVHGVAGALKGVPQSYDTLLTPSPSPHLPFCSSFFLPFLL